MSWVPVGQAARRVVQNAERRVVSKPNYIPPDNSGNLFRLAAEDRKSDKHPEYEGEFKVVCPHCQGTSLGWVKAWVKEAKTGSKFFSLAFKFKEKRQ